MAASGASEGGDRCSAASPSRSARFRGVGRDKMASPPPSPQPVMHWCSELIFLQPLKHVLKCLKVTETGQARAPLLPDTPRPARVFLRRGTQWVWARAEPLRLC